MSMQPISVETPTRHLVVYRADAFRVAFGVNEGEPIEDAAELVHDDVYELTEHATPIRLGLSITEDGRRFHVAAESEAGQPSAPVYLDSLLTFMGPAGHTLEALVFVEVDPHAGTIAQIYFHPLTPILHSSGYALVTIDTETAAARLAASAMVAFTRGTRITLADGRLVPIEDLSAGDRVLTRDSGPQQVRWTGMQTMRAEGPFAPITIAPGILHNDRALVVSPNHRLFIYQRVDALGAGRKEVLVKAGLLVNGISVTQDSGGFVDYFQILFDKHEIIYAEGIAAESLFIDTASRPGLPKDVAQRFKLDPAKRRPLPGHELGERDLATPNAAEMLRRISAM